MSLIKRLKRIKIGAVFSPQSNLQELAEAMCLVKLNLLISWVFIFGCK